MIHIKIKKAKQIKIPNQKYKIARSLSIPISILNMNGLHKKEGK